MTLEMLIRFGGVCPQSSDRRRTGAKVLDWKHELHRLLRFPATMIWTHAALS